MIAALVVAATGCSTQKNTAKSRRWHSFMARYNTYYNGAQAYVEGALQKENGNKDNYTEMIPLYTVGNKANRETGKGNFDRAVEKCQKTIKLHSIKRRPQWTKSRRKTPKDIEWLSRKEYNPFLWKAWMLMGRAQFHKGAFDEAASTFAYMSRLYHTQPAIYGKARAWLAKCYVEEGWLYDAEDVIRNMNRDSIHYAAQKEWDYTLADYYIHTGDYDKAITYLKKVIKHEMRRKQKARECFLLGQLYAATGRHDEALKAYKRVTRLNPPYELEFNARIAMTENVSPAQSRKMIGRLKRMAASDKNKDYLDQVYYAIGNIHLSNGDTAMAINAYERGAAKATRTGIEKGVLLLRLGDIYWQRERYDDAQRCYGQAIGMLDKERKDYETLSKRSKILDELVPYTNAIHLQDSLQMLAAMDEKDRNAAIDRTIEALKRKEKEERDRLAEQNAQDVARQNGGNNATPQRNNPAAQQQDAQGAWYFYNPMAVSQGKTAFERAWGKRENADDWQRNNKTVVAFGTEGEPEWTEEQLDSIAAAEAAADSLEMVADSAQNDPHKREYYLAQIPFTPEQVEASNAIIADGLYNSGVIFKDKLNNLALAEKQFQRLLAGYPSFDRFALAYYHLYLLYMRKGDSLTAETYVQKLKEEFPDNEYTILLTDPYFVENAKAGKHMEDSLYAATYDAFKAGRYGEVKGNVAVSDSRFPLGANRDKFIFIGALGKLNEGDATGCVDDLRAVVKHYPKSGVAKIAGMIVRGVEGGRQMQGGKFDLDDIWQRRSVELRDSDSTAVKEFTPDRNLGFVFMIAFKPDSVDQNRLLFELARYNFTSYVVRNFEIESDNVDGLQRMYVKGFRNYDEALVYARNLHASKAMSRLTQHCRTMVISEQNMQLVGRQFSYDDYMQYYDANFAPIEVTDAPLLNEPDAITVEKPARKPDAGDVDDGYDLPDDDARGGGSEVILEEEPEADATDDNGTTVMPDDNGGNGNNADDNGTVVVPDNVVVPDDNAVVPNGNVVVPDDNTVIPDDNTVISDDNTVIPEDNIVVPDDDNVIVTEEETVPAAPATPKAPQQTVVPDVESTSAGAANGTVKETPGQNDTPKAPTQEVKPEVQEDEFYFEDTPQGNKGNGGKPNKTTTVYEDDEYYELDGF